MVLSTAIWVSLNALLVLAKVAMTPLTRTPLRTGTTAIDLIRSVRLISGSTRESFSVSSQRTAFIPVTARPVKVPSRLKYHSDVWGIIAAASAADHFFAFAQRDGGARCSRERLHSLNELVDVFEDGGRELDLRSGVLCNRVRHIGLLDAGSSCRTI